MLRSPHVIQIHDYGVEGDVPFIAMELLEGESLASRLRARPLGREVTWRVIDQVLRAVGKAHHNGIVHRDLKPANIFITPNDAEESPLLRETWLVKVLDFGIAKHVDASEFEASPHIAEEADTSAPSELTSRPVPEPTEPSTAAGTTVGTPQYMSPEQTRARPVDARSDLWSVGVIAYECIVGKTVFTREAFGSMVLQICVEALPVPSAHAEVPDGFDAWFFKALQRSPDDRFQTATEMAEALRLVLAPTPPLQPDTARSATGATRPRAYWRVAGALGVTAVLGIVGWRVRLGETLDEAGSAGAASEAAETTALAAPSAQRATPTLEQRRLTFRGGARGIIGPTGDTLLFATDEGPTSIVWRQHDDQEAVELLRLSRVHELAISPSGVELICGQTAETAPDVMFTIAQDRTVAETEAKCFEAAWSPDSRTVAVIEGTTRKDFTLRTVDGATRQLPIDGDYQWLIDVAWSPSADKILVVVTNARGENQLLSVSIQDGKTTHLLPEQTRFSSVVSSEHSVYLLRPSNGALEVLRFDWDSENESPRVEPEVLLTGVQADRLSVSRDGRKLAYTRTTVSSNLWLLEPSRGMSSRVQLTRGAREHVHPTFSPDGTALAMIRRANNAELIVMPVAGGPEQRISAPEETVKSLVWGPTGGALAYMTAGTEGPRVHVSDLKGGRETLELGQPIATSTDNLAWAPGATLWFQTAGNRNFAQYNFEQKTTTPLFTDPQGWTFYPTQNEVGDLVVFRNLAISDGEGLGVWHIPADTRVPRKLANGWRLLPIRYTSDNKGLYVTNLGAVGVPVGITRIPLRSGAPEPVLQFDFAPDQVATTDITADGKRAVVSVEKRESDIWVAEFP